MPGTMSDLPGQEFTLLAMSASMPWPATVGVSVLPSSVMSGPPLPLASAFCHCVVRTVHGTNFTVTAVLAYCGNCLWHCATTPFIQVTWAGVDAPMRHTVSCAGAAVLPEDAGALLLEPQAAAAIRTIGATAVTAATLVSFIGGS